METDEVQPSMSYKGFCRNFRKISFEALLLSRGVELIYFLYQWSHEHYSGPQMAICNEIFMVNFD